MGEAVQQLSQDGKRLRFIAESLHPSLQRRRENLSHVREIGQRHPKQPAGHHRLHEHEQSVYRDGNGTGIGLHAPE